MMMLGQVIAGIVLIALQDHVVVGCRVAIVVAAAGKVMLLLLLLLLMLLKLLLLIAVQGVGGTDYAGIH